MSGRSKRASYQSSRPRKLTPDQEAMIRALAGTKSLRSLAAEFGVSHETIRIIVRQGREAAG
jgi:transposase